MKLKQIIGTTISKSRFAPVISICYFNGRMTFNKSTSEMLGLKENDSLAFFQDQDKPTDWYFKKSGSKGAVRVKRSGFSLVINNAGIARAILQSLGAQRSVCLFIGEQKFEGMYWTILSEKSKRK